MSNNNKPQLHVLITGGSSGIGFELVNYYLLQHSKVSTCARNLQGLMALAKSNKALFIQQVDVTQAASCQQFVQDAIKHNGPIDILINNAGISMRALFADTDIKVLQQVMDINFWGSLYMSKAALPSIMATKGVICNVSSIAGYRGLPARSGYSASKFALQGFSESLRTELLHTGVHVMWVSPGFTASNIRNVALNNNGHAQQESPLAENKLMSAAVVAQYIARAISKRQRTIVLTAQGKLTVWLNKWWPSLADKLVYNHFAQEAQSPIQ
jgi:short-subunit dehydrogenase